MKSEPTWSPARSLSVGYTSRMANPNSRRALLTAALIVLALERLVPFGRTILFPFTLLATWVHEMGHGMAALLVGGRFDRLQIFADASGLAHTAVTAGWRDAFVSAGGLLGPPLVGAFTLAFARGPRRATMLLFVFAFALLSSAAIWVRSAVGLISMTPLAIVFALVAWRASGERRLLAMQLMGVLLALDTVTGIDYLFTSNVRIAGQDLPSDITTLARALGGPTLLWGLVLAAISFALLLGGLWIAWRPSVTRRPH